MCIINADVIFDLLRRLPACRLLMAHPIWTLRLLYILTLILTRIICRNLSVCLTIRMPVLQRAISVWSCK